MAAYPTLTARLPTPSSKGVSPWKKPRSYSLAIIRWSILWFIAGIVATRVTEFAVFKSRVDSSLQLRESMPTMTSIRPRFVLFGDSLTQQSFREGGWGASLQDLYSRQADVVVRGYGGYNTRWALFLLNKIFPKVNDGSSPALVTIFFGANDAALPDLQSKRQHVPVPEYSSNLNKIIDHIQSISAETRIVLLTPPPVDEDGRLAYAKVMYGDQAVEISERQNAVTQLYAEACVEVAAKRGLAVVDLWTAVQMEPQWKKLLSDGLHFTAQGNELVFRKLVSVINGKSEHEWRPSLSAAAMDSDFPHHSEIDGEHPELSFPLE